MKGNEMTYQQSFEMSNPKHYELAIKEGWLAEWEAASEHVRIADFDFSAGIIANVNEYDD